MSTSEPIINPMQLERFDETLLVVEDDAAMRQALASTLSQEGYVVVSVPNGKAALDALREGLDPSLIVLDLVMPEMDGRQFRFEQLQDPNISDIPVLVMSGRPTEPADGSLHKLDFLPKPFTSDALLRVVDERCMNLIKA